MFKWYQNPILECDFIGGPQDPSVGFGCGLCCVM